MRDMFVILSSFSLHIDYDQAVAEKPLNENLYKDDLLTLISENLEVQRKQPATFEHAHGPPYGKETIIHEYLFVSRYTKILLLYKRHCTG